MGIVRTGLSAYDKELQKWEQFPTYTAEGVAPAGNPYVYRPYPAMLYKAFKRANGQYKCMDTEPLNLALYAGNVAAMLAAEAQQEAFNRSCYVTVQSEAEKDAKWAQGWRESPKAALEYAEALEQEIAQAAAEVNFGVARMSEQARKEHADADAATSEHVVDIVGSGAKKRGRPGRKPRAIAPMETEA